MRLYVDRTADIDKIVRRCYPAYAGKRIVISDEIPAVLDSFWDGGHRDYYVFLSLHTGEVYSVHSNHPDFEPGQPRNLRSLPAGVLLVQLTYSGQERYLTIYAEAGTLTPMLPPKLDDLSPAERIVLVATRTYKPSYNGIKNLRFREAEREAGITLPDWEAAKGVLIRRGFLNAAGAITTSGRNAAGREQLRALGKQYRQAVAS
jgi:hypothetical protein